MAKPENGSFRSELLSFGLYKRNQGRLARQLTFAGLALLVVAGAYILSQGPLAGLADQYYRVVFVLPKDDTERVGKLDRLAAEHSLTHAEDTTRGGQREVEFRAQVSRLWVTSEDRMTEGKKNVDDLIAAAKADLGLKPLRPEPELRTPKPVGVVYGVPLILCAIFGWIIFRLVNYPRFAEFLISVEAEMNKVSWASKQELYRATVVVLSTMVLLGVVLMVYDTLWYHILQFAGVLRFSQ